MDLDRAREFLHTHHRGLMLTYRVGGGPQMSPIVCGVDDEGHVIVSTRETAAKTRNLLRDPRTSICVISDGFQGPWVQVDGIATIVRLPEAMEMLVSYYRSLAGEHPDWDDYRAAMERERRVLVRIELRVRAPMRPDDQRPVKIGDTATRSRAIIARDIELFTELTGDHNPLHYDKDAATRSRFGGIIVQGGVTSGLLNALAAEDLPGPGSVFLDVEWNFRAPVRPGDVITATAEVVDVHRDKPICTLKTTVTNQDGTVVLDGTAVVYRELLPGPDSRDVT